MIDLRIYSRPGCHLCEVMKEVVERVARQVPVTIQEVDISADPSLETEYGAEIPVLFVNGRKAAKYRITERELLRVLQARPASAAEGR